MLTYRALIYTGTAVRIAYGASALFAPAKMVCAQLAPDTHGQPDPRLTLRAFGGHQLVVGALTLAAMRENRLTPAALLLSMLIDGVDVSSALLEWRERAEADSSLIGGIALSGSGIVTFGAALALHGAATRS